MEFSDNPPEDFLHSLKLDADESLVVLAAFREDAARRLAQQLSVGVFTTSMIEILKNRHTGAIINLNSVSGICSMAFVLDSFAAATPEVVHQLATSPTAYKSDDAMVRQTMGDRAAVLRDQLNKKVAIDQEVRMVLGDEHDQTTIDQTIDEIERYLGGEA